MAPDALIYRVSDLRREIRWQLKYLDSTERDLVGLARELSTYFDVHLHQIIELLRAGEIDPLTEV